MLRQIDIITMRKDQNTRCSEFIIFKIISNVIVSLIISLLRRIISGICLYHQQMRGCNICLSNLFQKIHKDISYIYIW